MRGSESSQQHGTRGAALDRRKVEVGRRDRHAVHPWRLPHENRDAVIGYCAATSPETRLRRGSMSLCRNRSVALPARTGAL